MWTTGLLNPYRRISPRTARRARSRFSARTERYRWNGNWNRVITGKPAPESRGAAEARGQLADDLPDVALRPTRRTQPGHST